MGMRPLRVMALVTALTVSCAVGAVAFVSTQGTPPPPAAKAPPATLHVSPPAHHVVLLPVYFTGPGKVAVPLTPLTGAPTVKR